MNRPLFISICLVLTGLIYHHHGAGDWLAPTTIPESWALMPFPGTKEKTK